MRHFFVKPKSMSTQSLCLLVLNPIIVLCVNWPSLGISVNPTRSLNTLPHIFSLTTLLTTPQNLAALHVPIASMCIFLTERKGGWECTADRRWYNQYLPSLQICAFYCFFTLFIDLCDSELSVPRPTFLCPCQPSPASHYLSYQFP